MKKTKKDSKKKTKKSEDKKEEKLVEEIKQAEKAITHSIVPENDRSRGRLREALNDKEEIEQDFFEEPVRQISISTETKAPVLERIIQRQMPIENPVEIEQQRETRGERRIDYSPVSNEPNYGFARNTEDEEKKYESTFVPPVLTRMEISGNEMRQEFLKPQNETLGNKINENWQSIDIDIVEEETRLPFEEQKKYKRFKLR